MLKGMKKMIKPMKKLCVMVLMALATITTIFITSAIANELGAVPTPISPTTAPIEKTLEMPVGTPVPAVTFTFNTTGVTRLNASGDPIAGSLPTIPDATITFATTDTTTASGTTITVTRHIANLLAGVTWTEPGHYVFHVSESATVGGVPANGDVDVDTRVYEMHVIVSEDDGVFTVTGVYIWNTVDPNRDLDDETGKVEYMSFTNTYVQTGDLIVSKTVTGSLSSTTSDFPITVDFTDHSLVALVTLPGVTAHIRNSDGTGTETVVTLPVTNVNLRHGQEIIFRNVPIGNTFVVTEDPGAYVPSMDLTLAGDDITPAPEGATTGTQTIGYGDNIVAFTNTNEAAPITGVIMNNLPFIVVALAAVGIFAMTFANKKSREIYA